MDIVDYLENKSLKEVAPLPLSGRELETLRAISRGYDVAGVAKLLKISRNTVKVYMANLSQKIGIPTTRTNFRVVLCIFYNRFKRELKEQQEQK